MTVYFKPERRRWLYDFQIAGQRFNGNCIDPQTGEPAKNKRHAQDIEAELKLALRRSNGVVPSKPGSYSIAQALQAFALSAKDSRHATNNLPIYIREIARWFGPTTPITDIGADKIQLYIKWGLSQKVMIWKGGSRKDRRRDDPRWWAESDRTRSPSTLNRYLTTLRGSLLLAHRTRDPLTGHSLLPFPPTVPDLDEPKRLARPIPNAPMTQILDEAAQHVAEAAALCNHFPLRKAEVVGLRISHIDEHARGLRIPAEETKANREEFFPASDAAWAFLEYLVAQARRRGTDHLIAWLPPGKDKQWQPVKNFKRAWKSAQKRAKISKPYRFHDTKAAFSSNLRAGGADPGTVMRMSRHTDPTTTDRYLDAVDDLRRDAVERLAEKTTTTKFMQDRVAGVERNGKKSPVQQSRTGLGRPRLKAVK